VTVLYPGEVWERQAPDIAYFTPAIATYTASYAVVAERSAQSAFRCRPHVQAVRT